MPIPALVQPRPAGRPVPPEPVREPEPVPVACRPAAAFREDLAELQHFRATVRTRGWNGLHMRAPGGRAYEAPDMVIRVSGELTAEHAAEIRERFEAYFRGHREP